MTIRTRYFNIPAHLETDEDIRKFLRKTTHSGVASDFILALNTAARARVWPKSRHEPEYRELAYTNHSN
jgi:hypothetical protein